MQHYRASGRLGVVDVAIIVVVALVAGLVVGAIASYIGRFFHLFLLFPALMGVAVGMIGYMVVNTRRVRAPMIAGLVFAIGGSVAWGVDLVLDYSKVRSEIRADAQRHIPNADAQMIEAAVDQSILFAAYAPSEENGEALPDGSAEEEYAIEGRSPFVAYVVVRVRQGTSIGRAGSSSRGSFSIGSTGTVILWSVEALLAAIIAGSMVGAAAAHPFCESCEAWYADAMPPIPLAGAPEDALGQIERENHDALRLRPPEEMAPPWAALRLRICESCETAPAHADVLRVELGKDGKSVTEKVVHKSVLIPDAKRLLNRFATEHTVHMRAAVAQGAQEAPGGQGAPASHASDDDPIPFDDEPQRA